MENIYITEYNSSLYFLVIENYLGYIIKIHSDDGTLDSPCPCCMYDTHIKKIAQTCKEAASQGKIKSPIVWKGHANELSQYGIEKDLFREISDSEVDIFDSASLKAELKKFWMEYKEKKEKERMEYEIKIKKAQQKSKVEELIEKFRLADAKIYCEITGLNFSDFVKKIGY